MKSEKLLRAFGQIDDQYVEEYLRGSQAEEKSTAHRPKISRLTLIAAIVALMLFLMGCAWMVIRMQDLKIGTHTVTQAEYDDSGSQTSEKQIQLEVLSFQGIRGTPNYQASQEWLAFTQSYTPVPVAGWDSAPDYWSYALEDQTMVDKLDEICEKYGLKIIGKSWHEQRDCTEFLKLAGVDSLLKPDSEAEIQMPQGRFFPGGSFNVYGSIMLDGSEDTLPFAYDYIKKDVFYDVFAYVNKANITERNYTTSDGVNVLLLESEQGGTILAQRADGYLSIGVDGKTDLDKLADQLDFTIQTKPLDADAADALEQASMEAQRSADPDLRYTDPNYLQRETYGEYVEDFLWRGTYGNESPEYQYAFYDLDGNGQEELLIFYDDGNTIGNVVGMKDGRTDEGKNYCIQLCEDNVLIDRMDSGFGEVWYHIFRFANNDDPVFSNPKERSIVRLMKDSEGLWWRTSSTDWHADFDTQITEAEAMEILNSYKPIYLDTRPLTEFEDISN